MTRFIRLFAILSALAVLGWSMPALAGGDPEIEKLLRKTDDMYRGESSYSRISMNVKTKHFERSLTMEAWSKGTEKSLIRILAPAKEKGVSTLKVEDNLWNYLPKVDRTIKVPASMMSGSWMGSHFTNDDLVKESRFSDDFDWKATEKPGPDGNGQWVVELVPREDTAVVWGKVVSYIKAPEIIATKVEYYDEKGKLVRTMFFEDIKKFGELEIPAKMRLVPTDKPEEFTEVVYETLELGQDIKDDFFSLRSLKR